MGITYKSPTNRDRLRTKANVCPSGAKAGPLSTKPWIPPEVSLRLSPVSTESRYKLADPSTLGGRLGLSVSVMISHLLSGDHARNGPGHEINGALVSPTFRSRPPSDGKTNMPPLA